MKTQYYVSVKAGKISCWQVEVSTKPNAKTSTVHNSTHIFGYEKTLYYERLHNDNLIESWEDARDYVLTILTAQKERLFAQTADVENLIEMVSTTNVPHAK